MSLITIGADVPKLDSIIRKLERAGMGEGLPYTKEAVQSATRDVVQRTWIQYASGAEVHYSGGTFRINVISGEYLRSIEHGLRFPEDLTGEVFSDAPYASIIEEGQPPRDMKDALLASPKAKTGKDGKKYITIPFRHGTPGTTGLSPMPQSVYNQAKQLSYSRRNNLLQKVGGFIQGNGWKKYQWGGRLGANSTGQRSHINPHPGGVPIPGKPQMGKGYTWKTGQFSGMVRMGKPGHSQYMTFRRLSENSDPRSWMFPGVKPRPVTEAVAENTRNEVIALIRAGFEMDLYFMGLGGGN